MSKEIADPLADGCGVSDADLTVPAGALLGDAERPARWLSDLHRDLDVVSSSSGALTLTAALGGERTRLRGGREYLEALVSRCPCDDSAVLRRRQDVLRRLEEAGLGGSKDDDEASAARLAALEPDALWFFRLKEDEALQAVVDTAYFGVWPATALNRTSPSALSARLVYQVAVSPLVGVLSPILYFVVPYIVLCMSSTKGIPRISFLEYLWHMARSAMGWAQKAASASTLIGRSVDAFSSWAQVASALLSMAMYFSSVVSSFQVSAAVRRVCRTVSDRVDGALEFGRETLRRSAAVGWDAEAAEAWFPGARCCSVPTHGRLPTRRPIAMLPCLAGALGKDPCDLASGHRLCAAATFDRKAAEASLRTAYAMDAVAALLRSRSDLGMCWAEYVDGGGGDNSPPELSLRGLRHPCLDPSSASHNDWSLGGGAANNNALLTGPNAGGKSTLMKAALCAALTAQTLCIAACTECRLTPFSVVSSHLNIADLAGSESLFQAEMARAQRVIADLDSLSPSQRALVALDEVFSSTNPIEGISAATAVARRLARHPGAIIVVSTHYLHLCALLKASFATYGMPVELDAMTGAVRRYPYRLQRGPCRQYVALELMRASGFDEGVTGDAIAVKNALLLPVKKGRRKKTVVA
jgi:hypothetical protein